MTPQDEYRRVFAASLRMLADRIESGAEQGRATQFYYHEEVKDDAGNVTDQKVTGLSLVIHMGDQKTANDAALSKRLLDLQQQAADRAAKDAIHVEEPPGVDPEARPELN